MATCMSQGESAQLWHVLNCIPVPENLILFLRISIGSIERSRESHLLKFKCGLLSFEQNGSLSLDRVHSLLIILVTFPEEKDHLLESKYHKHSLPQIARKLSQVEVNSLKSQSKDEATGFCSWSRHFWKETLEKRQNQQIYSFFDSLVNKDISNSASVFSSHGPKGPEKLACPPLRPQRGLATCLSSLSR